MARRFDLAAVGHSAAVFDTDKLAWMNRHYMKEASPVRLAREVLPYLARAGYVDGPTAEALGFVESILPLVAGSVDRLDEVPARVAFLFNWQAQAVAPQIEAEPDGLVIVRALADALMDAGPLDRESFRAAAARVREATGFKGRALFHPIRVALTGAESGPELDLAVPAIDRGAALPREAGVRSLPSCAERARRLAERSGN
jgi:glutamyl/glutaminyl-tRNA synthetase